MNLDKLEASLRSILAKETRDQVLAKLRLSGAVQQTVADAMLIGGISRDSFVDLVRRTWDATEQSLAAILPPQAPPAEPATPAPGGQP